MSNSTNLRPLHESDHDAVFSMMAEPESVAMAAFTAEDPTDRAAFDRHMRRIQTTAGVRNWAVVDQEAAFVGTIATFESDDGLPEVTYWIAREHWGHGHASNALAMVLSQTGRPVLARLAHDNVASRRVLEKAGFVVVGRNRDWAPGRRAEIDEVILRLD